MKKIMSMTGVGLVAITLLMSSCVSKKKYVAAQNTIEQYRADSARMAQEAATQRDNIASLEEKNRSIQAEYDSTKTAYEQKWSGIESYYNEQKANAEQLHQTISQSLASSEVIDPSGIMSSNGRVYVTLDDQVFSGNSLNSKGREALNQFAGVIKDKDNVSVDVVSGDAYAAYWNSSASGAMGDASMSGDNSTANNNTMDSEKTDDDKDASVATTTTTKKTTTTRPKSTYRKGTAKRSTATASRSTKARKATYTKSRTESGRNMAFKSKSKKSSTSSSWTSKVAKATAIAKELHKNGVYNVGLMIPGQNSNGSNANTENSNKFQLIVTPKGESYYQMMEKNSSATPGTTSMK